MKTASVNKHDLMQHAQQDMQKWISDLDLTDRQKLALTCRILFDHGHDAGLAGQITCRSENKETFITQRFGLGFDEITASNLLEVNQDLEPINQEGMANPANRFHTWIYKEHPEVNCIIHTSYLCSGPVDATDSAYDFPNGRLRTLRRLLIYRSLAGSSCRE